MRVSFFKPYITGKELVYIRDLLTNKKDLSGDGEYSKRVHALLESRYKTPKALLTTSCSTALEMAVRLLDLSHGDEIITPSFTFSSTVNAILVQQGIKPVFADVDPETLNINPKDIRAKITKKTKAIIVVHYAGVSCDMDKIMAIAKQNNLRVIEDAAQAIDSKYKGRYLGTIGDFGCLSFHDTKNIICGEGGAIFINSQDPELLSRAEIIREKGTNRSKFFRGEIDKYTWVDVGSSMLPSDILAAFLLAQMESIDEILSKRKRHYDYYAEQLKKLERTGLINIPRIPKYADHNAHIFYLLARNGAERNFILDFLKSNGIEATFHYVPLHSAPQGISLGNKKGDLPVTESISKRIIRLPLYSAMTKKEGVYVVKTMRQALVKLAKLELERSLEKQFSIRRFYPLVEKEYSQDHKAFI